MSTSTTKNPAEESKQARHSAALGQKILDDITREVGGVAPLFAAVELLQGTLESVYHVICAAADGQEDKINWSAVRTLFEQTARPAMDTIYSGTSIMATDVIHAESVEEERPALQAELVGEGAQ
jgi:hypothetical protein